MPMWAMPQLWGNKAGSIQGNRSNDRGCVGVGTGHGARQTAKKVVSGQVGGCACQTKACTVHRRVAWRQMRLQSMAGDPPRAPEGLDGPTGVQFRRQAVGSGKTRFRTQFQQDTCQNDTTDQMKHACDDGGLVLGQIQGEETVFEPNGLSWGLHQRKMDAWISGLQIVDLSKIVLACSLKSQPTPPGR